MEASLSGRRKTNEARASAGPTVIRLATAMFVLPLVLLALYLFLSSMFNTTHLRAFQFALSILLVFFALTMESASDISTKTTTARSQPRCR